eukprot:GHVU01182728.1.p1 GENE.GHVU01182728.1~~GHVU01182728.1.p1  ORF type:complete len:395 (+),score=89.56 GHVU01182728.1:280-1464(+)
MMMLQDSMFMFNLKDGYTEALLRGLRSGLLTPEDYRRLALADSLEDLRSALEDTDYGGLLQDEAAALTVPTFGVRCRERLAEDFFHLKSQSNQPLVRFMEFISIEKMIDNTVSLITGTINKKPMEELMGRLDPLGLFPELTAIGSMDFSAGYDDLYRSLLIETPVGPYFEEYLKTTSALDTQGAEGRGLSDVANMLGEADLEIMRNILKKCWLEDFHRFCLSLGGTTAEVMGDILQREADFRVLAVTLNSINTSLGSSSQLSDRNSLYPSFGYLYPDGTDKIRRAWNDATVRSALECFPKYLELYDRCKEYYFRDDEEAGASAAQLKPIEDLLYHEQMVMCELAFEQQMHYGVYYAWVKLKEQEIRNIVWIADMILMRRKEHIDEILPIFAPRY